MKQGQYIVDRYLPDFVRSSAEAIGVQVDTFSDDWVLRLQRDNTIRWVLGYQFDLNAAAASAIAQDKVATHLLLKREGIPSVEHILLRSLPHQKVSESMLRDIFSDSPFVIKPLDGSGGRGVMLAANAQEASKVIQASDEVAWAASPYYVFASEYRLIILDGAVLLAYEKTQPVQLHGLRFYNLGLGAQAIDITDEAIMKELENIGHRACSAASLRIAAVDIAHLADGRLLVLEVNDGIMMENYARQSPKNKDRASGIYDSIVGTMFA